MVADFSVSLPAILKFHVSTRARTHNHTHTQHSPVQHTLKAQPRTVLVQWRQICRQSVGATLSSELGGRNVALQVKRMEMKTLDRKIGEGGIKKREY